MKREPDSHESLTLDWQRFTKLTAARSEFAKTACVYVQTDAQGHPIRVGKASKGLEARYRGGTGYAIDAGMHDSDNLVFVAKVSDNLCEHVETELIWRGRRCLPYNNQGKISAPRRRLLLVHDGTSPKFDEFEAESSTGPC